MSCVHASSVQQESVGLMCVAAGDAMVPLADIFNHKASLVLLEDSWQVGAMMQALAACNACWCGCQHVWAAVWMGRCEDVCQGRDRDRQSEPASMRTGVVPGCSMRPKLQLMGPMQLNEVWYLPPCRSLRR